LEVYRVENPGIPLRVYWPVYNDSVEHHKYDYNVEREEQIWRDLIRTKETMIIDSNQDGKVTIDLEKLEEGAELSFNSRKGGIKKLVRANKVHLFYFSLLYDTQ